jgi:exosome complex RNA-binding protein Rrp4
VIGVVVAKSAEHYKVDIGTAQQALLGVLAFEGATKRNKPDIKVNRKGCFVAKNTVIRHVVSLTFNTSYSHTLIPSSCALDWSIGVLQDLAC